MLGAPGSGKGTQGKRLAARFGVPHLSTGELLRLHIRGGTPLGVAAQDDMRRGDLIADELVIAMVFDELGRPHASGGYVLDGFPRTVPQATAAYDAALAQGLTARAVIFLDIPYDELGRRLDARARRSGREDDDEMVVRHRVEVYRAETVPLLDYYEGRGLLLRVDADGTVDEVEDRIRSSLESVGIAGSREPGASPLGWDAGGRPPVAR